MSAHAYTEDQQAQRTLTRPLPEEEEVEQPTIGLFAELGWTTLSASEEVFGSRDETHPFSAESQSLLPFAWGARRRARWCWCPGCGRRWNG